jgi:mono/diheme cytochrome c family protein
LLYAIGRSRLASSYAIEAESVPVLDDSATLARGEHLVHAVIGCGECHGERLEGRAFFDDPALGTVTSANLTPGAGSATAEFTDQDWVMAIRHAIGQDRRSLIAMPSANFINMSAEDLGAVISYLKTLEPVDTEAPPTKLRPLTYILVALGQLDDAMPAGFIDHDAPFPDTPPEGPTAEYGEYLVGIATCRDCHGRELASGQAGPGEPIGPNLTPAGELAGWSQDDFVRLLRTGRRPDGRQAIDFMPWRHYRNMTDTELEAIWRYLQTLEPRETPAEFQT